MAASFRAPVIEIELRALAPDDETALRTLFDNEDTRLWNPGPSAEDLPAWLAEMSTPAADHRTWAVVEAGRRTNELDGLVSIFGISPPSREAEIGFRTMPAARGRGIARAAVALACQKLADENIVDELVLFHAVGNPASCRVAIASGFALEETLPGNFTYGDGKVHDEHRHRRLLGKG